MSHKELDDQVAALQARVQALSKKVMTDAVRKEIDALIAELPSVEQQQGLDAKRKASLLVLHARAKLLLPAYSKDAETELSKALKLRPTDVEAWVAMSECLWKREALVEARDALNSALGIEPQHIGALCQLSRILRACCNRPDVSNDDRAAMMAEAVAKAKAAVEVDMASGEAWAALGVALIQQTVATGMDLAILSKAHQALVQACRRNESDPDVHYNRGVVRKCLGEFGGAAEDFAKAFELDPVGLPMAKRDKEVINALLQGFAGILASFASETAPEKLQTFKKTVLNKLPVLGDGGREFLPLRVLLKNPTASRPDAPPRWLAVRALELVSGPTEQPLCYLAADRDATFCALLVYRTTAEAIKPGSTVMVALPPGGVAEHVHNYVAEPKPDAAAGGAAAASSSGAGVAKTLSLPCVLAEPTALFVNGAPVPKHMFKSPSLATRQFV